MKINLYPQRRDDRIELVKQGDALIVNGIRFDFAQLPEGATLPANAIASELFCGPVDRVGGELIINLILPHGSNPSQDVAFPEPIVVNSDGPIAVPRDPEPSIEEEQQ